MLVMGAFGHRHARECSLAVVLHYLIEGVAACFWLMTWIKLYVILGGTGTLTVGGPADIALLAIEQGRFPLVDCQGNAVTARHRIVNRLTICRGQRMLFRGSQGADSIKSV